MDFIKNILSTAEVLIRKKSRGNQIRLIKQDEKQILSSYSSHKIFLEAHMAKHVVAANLCNKEIKDFSKTKIIKVYTIFKML